MYQVYWKCTLKVRHGAHVQTSRAIFATEYCEYKFLCQHVLRILTYNLCIYNLKEQPNCRKFSYFSQNITWNQADPRGQQTASLAEQVA